MADRRDDALIAELRDLAGWVEVPPVADGLAAAVMARVEAGSAAGADRWLRWPRRLRWSALSRRWRTAVAALVAVVCVVAVVPPARAAVVDAVSGLFRFAGIEISAEPGSLPATPSPLPSVRSAALDEARRVAKFPVRAPLALGVPDTVELADPAPDGAPRVVSLIYRGGTVRLDEFDGSIDPYFFKKGAEAAEFVTVNGDVGVWVPGPHSVTYVDRTGQEQTATGRLAGPTLIWTAGNVTYRLEGMASLTDAMTVAESKLAGGAVGWAAVPMKEDSMPHRVRGVVAREKDAPVTVEEIVVPDPGPGEALVRVQACGVCHTDLHYREGGIGNDYPYLLGHEAAGIVAAVGEGVTEVSPGDFVILNWRAVCGECRACRRGRPWYCFATHNATQKMTLADGTVLSPALGIGAFAELTLVAAGQCTPVDNEAPATVAGLLGCGVMAGIGAAINTGGVTRGDSVAVFGCGGVGDAAIAGAALAGATTIIGVDLDDRKLEWARGFGATHVINASSGDPVEKIKELTGGFGVDVAIEAVGLPGVYEQAFYARDLAGTVVLVGVPRPDMTLTLPFLEVFGRGGALKSSWYGDCLPTRDFPTLIALYRQGRLPLDKFVSEEIGIDDVEASFTKMHKGEVLRSVVVL